MTIAPVKSLKIAKIKRARKKWVRALRSGKYRQGKGQLRSLNDEFCCLGVWVDQTPHHWKKDDRGRWYIGDTLETSFGYLTVDLENSLGLSTGQTEELVILNDKTHYSFDQIADFIETLPIEL